MKKTASRTGYTVYRFYFDVTSMQIVTTNAFPSTCHIKDREEFPTVYIGDFGPQREDNAFECIEDALAAVRRLNKLLAKERHILSGISEYDLEQILCDVYGSQFGFWTSRVDPVQALETPARNKMIPQPRKPKNRKVNKHQIFNQVASKSHGKYTPHHNKIQSKTPPPPPPLSRRHEVQQELYPGQNEKLNRTASKIINVLFAPERRDYDKDKHHSEQKPKPLIGIGDAPIEFSADICRHIYNHYSVKPVAITADTIGSTAISERILIPGETDSKTKQLIKRYFKRQSARWNG